MTTALQIRSRREGQGLTQHELADLASVRPRTIQRYEAGVTVPDLIVGVRLARALGCTVEDLIHATDGDANGAPGGNRTPRRRSNAPGPGSTEETREQSAS